MLRIGFVQRRGCSFAKRHNLCAQVRTQSAAHEHLAARHCALLAEAAAVGAPGFPPGRLRPALQAALEVGDLESRAKAPLDCHLFVPLAARSIAGSTVTH